MVKVCYTIETNNIQAVKGIKMIHVFDGGTFRKLQLFLYVDVSAKEKKCSLSYKGQNWRNITEVRLYNVVNSTQLARGLDLQQAMELADWSSRSMGVNKSIDTIQRSNDLRDSDDVTNGAGTMMYQADNFVWAGLRTEKGKDED